MNRYLRSARVAVRRGCRGGIVLLAVTGLTAACSKSGSPTAPSPTPTPTVTVTSIAVTGTNAIEVGATSQLTATATMSDGSTSDVTRTATWESSNPAVVTVAGGRVSALTAGTATISAASDGRTGRLDVSSTAVDELQRVSVQVTDIVIDATCDDNNIFESSGDGEFEFEFFVTPSGSSTTRILATSRTLSRGAHTYTQGTSFTRNVTQGQDFQLRFVGTENDGLLGADPRMDGAARGRTFLYSGGTWTPSNRSLSIGSGSCGATINFTITSRRL